MAGRSFYAYGNTPEALLENACLAVQASMFDLSRVDGKITKELTFNESNLEKILYKLLKALVHFKETKDLVFTSFKVIDYKVIDSYVLATIQIQGEAIKNPKKVVPASTPAPV